MHTTLDIDDALDRQLEREAVRRGRTVRDLVTDGVRHVLDTATTDTAPGEAPIGAQGHRSPGSALGESYHVRRHHYGVPTARALDFLLTFVREPGVRPTGVALQVLDGLVAAARLPGAQLLTA